MIYLKKLHVMAMHQILIKKYGGISGLRSEDLLESALAQPRQSAFGEDLYPNLHSKAAAYAFSLSENQPFLDGNKRLATAVMGTFLQINNNRLICTEKQLYAMMMKLANGKLSRTELTNWLKKNSKPLASKQK